MVIVLRWYDRAYKYRGVTKTKRDYDYVVDEQGRFAIYADRDAAERHRLQLERDTPADDESTYTVRSCMVVGGFTP